MNERKAEPEPDVLERLEEWYANMVGIWASDYPKLIILADAIAEIERKNTKIRDHERRIAEDSVAIQEFKAQLRAIMEAGPVRWEFRERGSKGAWTTAKCAHPPALAAEFYEVRALAVVAPKAESDGA